MPPCLPSHHPLVLLNVIPTGGNCPLQDIWQQRSVGVINKGANVTTAKLVAKESAFLLLTAIKVTILLPNYFL